MKELIDFLSASSNLDTFFLFLYRDSSLCSSPVRSSQSADAPAYGGDHAQARHHVGSHELKPRATRGGVPLMAESNSSMGCAARRVVPRSRASAWRRDVTMMPSSAVALLP